MRIDFLPVLQRMFAATAANQGFCLSCDWAQLYESASLSHTWDQWYAVDYVMRTVPVPYVGMVVMAYHLYVDGSYYRRCFLTGWSFVVIAEDMSGNFCMMGYAADFISEQDVADFCSDMPDNIVAEAASILFAVAWLLSQEAVPA